MDAPKLKALKASIQKWDDNTRAEKPRDVILGRDDCPLCQEFPDCEGCPVMERTGNHGCLGTPYYRVAELHLKWFHGLPDKAEYVEAAIKEREFLISLLPDGEDWK